MNSLHIFAIKDKLDSTESTVITLSLCVFLNVIRSPDPYTKTKLEALVSHAIPEEAG